MRSLNPVLNTEPLPDTKLWEYRYYDSLDTPSKNSAQLAVAVMYALQPEVQFGIESPTAEVLCNNRAHKLRQGPTAQCGWYSLHYIEEEIRRFRGEGVFSYEFKKTERVDLVRKFRDKWVKLLGANQSWEQL